MSDQNHAQIVSAPAQTIEEVMNVMRRLDDALPESDGLKWFNLLYLKVTEAILAETVDHAWADPHWLIRLDVIFAGYYFKAIRNLVDSPAAIPKSWKVLFNARDATNIMRVQFAICGMNAHINHDLQFAIVQTCAESDVIPQLDSPQHRDYEFVNEILEAVEPRIKQFIATGILGQVDQKLGQLDDILSLWSVRKARETAWLNAQLFWPARDNPIIAKIKHVSVDNITSAFGRALIIPVM